MMTKTDTQLLTIKHSGDVTIVTFTQPEMRDEDGSVQLIGNTLMDLVDQKGARKIILDFTGVTFLTAAAYGKLISLDKKLKQATGKLIMCCLHADVCAEMGMSRMTSFMEIKENREEALEGI